MASSTEVSSQSSAKLSSHRGQTTYLPAIPPKSPRAAISYTRALQDAPYTALAGVIVDGRQPERHPVSMRHRVRNHVGLSNRWRLPESLGSDLLGSSQAVRAVSLHVNPSMVHIISAENPRLSLNSDMSKPYQFKAIASERPNTCHASISQERTVTSQPQSKLSVIEQPVSSPSRSRKSLLRLLTPKPEQPKDIFQYHSKGVTSLTGPDVLLKCVGMNWELHRPMLQKSDALSELLEAAENPSPKSYYKNKMSETLDEYVMKSSFYSARNEEMTNHVKTVETVDGVENVDESAESGIEHPKHISVQRINNMTVISLDAVDELVTQKAVAIALGNLYREVIEVPPPDVVGVLAAAHALRYRALEQGCADMMLKTISVQAVCAYHKAAVKFHQDHLQTACERWLELNLVPQMATRIELRQVSMELLQKALQANRLFTTNEFQLFKVVAFWTFLQMNPAVQLMPSYTAVLAYFTSLPKSGGLIEREEGQAFAPLFMSLRLHGITDTNHLKDVQSMNILPQAWIIKVLSQHYHSLQGGGDMSLLTNFYSDAIRQGFIINEEPHYHSEIFSLHGFHFELKGTRQNKAGVYSFYIQRLRPSDSVLSFRHCERSTFSLRPDREVRYCLRVQHVDPSGQAHAYCTPIEAQKFGLGNKTSKSKVVTLENLCPPIYVSFAFVFPPS